PCQTASADSRHGQPLDFPSCSNTALRSGTVTVGPNSLGFIRMVVCAQNSSAPFCNPGGGVLPKPDIRLTGSIRDVRCRSSLPAGCVAGSDYDPNSAAGPYTNAGGGTSGAQPGCFPSASSATACLAGADVTAVA